MSEMGILEFLLFFYKFVYVILIMRLEKLENLFDLALEMHVKRQGISLQDIMERFSVSRRTAVRMKDVILNVFPNVTEVKIDSKIKKWTIPNSSLEKISGINEDDLHAIAFAIKLLKENNYSHESKKLELLNNKLKIIISSSLLNKMETDLEVLLENELFSFRAGPRPIYDKKILRDIRFCLKACLECLIIYKRKKYYIEPYGILFGHRHYLVACDTKNKVKKLKYFSLSGINEIQISKNYFVRDENLSLKKLVSKSFGVFDEKPFDVEIVFDKKVADIANDFLFHPSQKFTKNSDKSLTLQFKSGGLIEMVWYFFRWGNYIEIKKPSFLKKLLKNHQKKWNIIP